MSSYNVVIIGSGPAGYTAAIYCSRAMLKTVIVTGFSVGGQLLTTTDVENFPGYPNKITGPKLMDDMLEQVKKFGTELLYTNVVSVDCSSRPFAISLMTNQTIFADAVIVASGAEAQWLNLEGEKKLRGKGISTCAVCDGAFFEGDDLIVIGGGDSAMEEANFLTKYAKKVTVIHRRNTFKASKIMLERAKNNPKIEWIVNARVKEWQTNNSGYLSGAILKIGDDEKVISCAGAFIAIGHKPNTSFLPDRIKTDNDGYILLYNRTETSVPGIFACGDVTDRIYKQAITAAGQGCQSALDVEHMLSSMKDHDKVETSETPYKNL